MKYLYKGMKGIYNGIHVVPGNVYEMENPNPRLFELVGEGRKQIVKEERKPIEPEKEPIDSVYSVMEGIHGIGAKAAAEIAEEYDSLEELKNDIENETFSVGGMSDKKIRLIKEELEIGE
jgi:NAD-dependent DNA ligase